MVKFISLAAMVCATTVLAQDDVLIERPLGTTDAGYGFLSYVPPGYSPRVAGTRWCSSSMARVRPAAARCLSSSTK